MGGIIQTIKMGSSQVIYPATTTNAVIHPDLAKPITDLMLEYNVSQLWPTSGVDDGNSYTLALAVEVLSSHLGRPQKVNGVKLSFIPASENPVTYEYEEWIWKYNDVITEWDDIDTFFTNLNYWTRCDIYNQNEQLIELQAAVFPLSVELSISPKNTSYDNLEKNVTLSWNVKRKGVNVTPTTLELTKDDVAVSGVSGSSKTIAINHRGLTKFQVTATYSGLTATSEVNYYQYANIYYGYSSSGSVTTKEIMEAFTSITSGSIGRTYTITLSDNGYAYFFVPSGLTITNATMNGFPYNLTLQGNTITGSNGVVYSIWRTTNLQTAGIQNIVIS